MKNNLEAIQKTAVNLERQIIFFGDRYMPYQEIASPLSIGEVILTKVGEGMFKIRDPLLEGYSLPRSAGLKLNNEGIRVTTKFARWTWIIAAAKVGEGVLKAARYDADNSPPKEFELFKNAKLGELCAFSLNDPLEKAVSYTFKGDAFVLSSLQVVGLSDELNKVFGGDLVNNG